MRSALMIGVEPLPVGSASVHASPSLVDHFTGSFVSGLVPRSSGPRHCGQSDAVAAAATRASRTRAARECFRIIGPPGVLSVA